MNNFIFQFLPLFILCFNNISGVPKYTDKEKIALSNFRELMGDALYKDYMKSDPYLIRWIRARNFDLNEARKMLHRALKWRKENQIDGILSQNLLEFRSPPFFYAGGDREGSSVLVAQTSKFDLRALLLNGKRQVLLRYWDQLLEFAESASLELLGIHPPGYTFSNVDSSIKFLGNDSLFEGLNTESGKYTIILDLQGFNLRQHACLACLGILVDVTQHYENFYTGYAKRFIVINAPRIAKPAIDLIRPLMSPMLRDIFEVYGLDRNEWIPVLHKMMSPSHFTKQLGGTKPD